MDQAPAPGTGSRRAAATIGRDVTRLVAFELATSRR